jgi:hypothetical protein
VSKKKSGYYQNFFSFCAAWSGTDKMISVREMVDNLGKNIIGIEVGVLLTTL